MEEAQGTQSSQLGASLAFFLCRKLEIELALIQKWRGSQLRILSSAVEKIITKIRSVVSERTPRLSTVSLHIFPPQWSDAIIPSQDIFSFRLRTEWRPLIGPHPSRYCALIGSDQSVATPTLLYVIKTQLRHPKLPTGSISRLSLSLYDIRTPIIDSLCIGALTYAIQMKIQRKARNDPSRRQFVWDKRAEVATL